METISEPAPKEPEVLLPNAVSLPSVAAFKTRQLRDATGFVRTHGSVVWAPAGAHTAWHETMPLMHADPPSADQAFGKVAILTHDPGGFALTCYQLAQSGPAATPAACSNATAAAAAWVGRIAGESDITLHVRLPDRTSTRVAARLERTSRLDTTIVSQTWMGLSVRVRREPTIDARSVYSCTGALNNYVIVIADSDEALSSFTIHDAVALWHHLGVDRDPLRARMAVIRPVSGGTAHARFFTCGEREHPSAPLTGLAVLSRARRAEIPELGDTNAVSTRMGTMDLPSVLIAEDGTASFDFAELLVTITPIEGSATAEPG